MFIQVEWYSLGQGSLACVGIEGFKLFLMYEKTSFAHNAKFLRRI